MAKKSGLPALVDELRAGGSRVEVQPRLPLDLDEPDHIERRGPGRPAGSRNKVTADMVEYLRRNYADPLEGMAQIASTPVDRLAAMLACTRAQALQFIQAAQRDLAPYLYSKLPAGLSLEGAGVFKLTIGDDADQVNGPAGDDGTAFDLVIDADQVDGENEQNQ